MATRSAADQSSTAWNEAFLKALAISAATLLQWGLISCVGGVGLILVHLVHRYRDVLLRVGRALPPPFRLPPPRLPADGGDPIANRAQRALRNIRFQRSYSSGWSGSLKLPAGLEAGANFAVSLAQQQQSLPEVVQEFREFAAAVAALHGKVIIGVDELDKLESDDKAQAFVNEIKAIFNIPNCFYLVSVSESAISNFQRRGLPFRDAFDSAFDEILNVGYFSLQDSARLLSRRVLNLPVPFLCICHCLSSGLPRDLIRVTRDAIGYARDEKQLNAISQVARALVQADARAKIHATEIAAREIALEPETTLFLTAAAPLERFDPAAVPNLSQIVGLKFALRDDLSDDEHPFLRKLIKLQLELEAYLLFAVTAAEIFSGLQTEQDWRQAIADDTIGGLAKAREAFELNPGIARFRVMELRLKRNLRIPQDPAGAAAQGNRQPAPMPIVI